MWVIKNLTPMERRPGSQSLRQRQGQTRAGRNPRAVDAVGGVMGPGPIVSQFQICDSVSRGWVPRGQGVQGSRKSLDKLTLA